MPRYPATAKMPHRPMQQEDTTPWARSAQLSLQRFHAVLPREVFVGNYTGDGQPSQTITHYREGTPDVIGVVARGSGTTQIGLWIGNNNPQIKAVGNTTFRVYDGAGGADDLNDSGKVYDYVMW